MQQPAEERGLLGKLCPGEKKLEGKTFYLDNVKKRSTALLLEAICFLGGRIESFLHKDVNFVVTGSQEDLKDERSAVTKGGAKSSNEEAQRPIKQRESVLTSEKQRPGTPRPVACGSRGKALLEKAIRNKEQLQRSSVLSNARSWGVKILYVDDVLLYLKQVTRESVSVKHKRPEKTGTKQQGSRVVKAASLRSPYLKIEDSSRKYKPLHMQTMTFPSLYYTGRFSPFESPPPPRFDKQTEQGENKTREKKKVESSIQDKSPTPLNPSPWRPRKKDTSYCECCCQPFTNLEEHLQSDQHRAFVLDLSNYIAVDQLVTEMHPGFNPNPTHQLEETLNRPPTPLPILDVFELEPLSDVETERAVQALRRQSSSFNTHITDSTTVPPPIGPASPSLQFPIPSPTTPPADIQCFAPTERQFPDLQPRASSPVMPVLEAEPQAHPSARQKPSLFPETECLSSDPYMLPPVLSPQLPYSSYIIEPHSPYSEPPVLSPQPYIAEEPVEGVVCEMDTTENLSEFVSSLPFMAVTNAEEVNGSEFSHRIICSRNSLECNKLALRRSRSLPRETATAPNPKKRSRSASSEQGCIKRRRTNVNFTGSCRWTEHWYESTKSKTGIMVKPEGCLFGEASWDIKTQCCPHENISSTCTMETLDLKQAYTFPVPTLQNFTQVPGQTDVSGHGSTSVAAPSTAKTSDRSLSDSQHSHSLSTSVCIEPGLIPDMATLSPSSSDSDWDCDLLSGLGPASAAPLPPNEQSCELDKELLHRPCTWMHDSSYESHLHTALQPPNPSTSLCGEEMDPSVFSRTVVQIVQVQH